MACKYGMGKLHPTLFYPSYFRTGYTNRRYYKYAHVMLLVFDKT